MRRMMIGLLAVAAVAAAVLLLPGATPPASATAPASCADVHAGDPSLTDGDYFLLAGGRIVPVYCHDMAGTPREYISLPNTGTASNFSQYTAGGASPGTGVRTSYTKVRIDPATLVVDIFDMTFASSTGSLLHSGRQSEPVSSMPYGSAMACFAPGTSTEGIGNVDLRGTPFAVADTFVPRAFQGGGTATTSAGDQVVNLQAGGYCGWIMSSPPDPSPHVPRASSFQLELKCLACSGIVVVKDALRPDPQDFSFLATGLEPSSFSLDDDADPTLPRARFFPNVSPGLHAVTELPAIGWLPAYVTCTGGSSVVTGPGLATITYREGEAILCTYANVPLLTPTPSPSPAPSPLPQPPSPTPAPSPIPPTVLPTVLPPTS